MNNEDIISMTIEASAIGSSDELSGDGIKRFADLVATFVASSERKACAKLVLDNATACDDGSRLQVRLASIAAAIRARIKS